MESNKEYLEQVKQLLADFEEEVNDALERADEENIDRHQFGLVRSVLDDLDERRERQEFIHSFELGGARTFSPPYEEDVAIGDTPRKRRMMELRRSIAKAWNEATSTYIAGQYYATAVTISVVVEGALKHELEREHVDFDDWNTSLSDTVSKARGHGILPHDGEVSDAANRIKKLRNDLAHFNIERGNSASEFSSRDDLDQRIPTDELDSLNGERIEMWREAAESAIKDAYLIADYLS